MDFQVMATHVLVHEEHLSAMHNRHDEKYASRLQTLSAPSKSRYLLAPASICPCMCSYVNHLHGQ